MQELETRDVPKRVTRTGTGLELEPTEAEQEQDTEIAEPVTGTGGRAGADETRWARG